MAYKTIILTLALACSAFAQDAAGTVAAMGYLNPAPVAVAPGQLITVFLSESVEGNIDATVQGFPAPVLEVRPAASPCLSSPNSCPSTTAITIQIPYDIGPSCIFTNPACDLAVLTQLIVTVNGVAGAPFNLIPQPDRVHFLTACDTVIPSSSGTAPINGLPCAPQVTHLDGSLVTTASPASGGEILVAYAVGLGLTNPAVPTGQAATAAAPTVGVFALDFNFRPNALATKPAGPPGPFQVPPPSSILVPQYAGLAPGYVGLYQINFVVPQPPAGTRPCGNAALPNGQLVPVQSNLTVSLGGETSFDGAGICVAP